MRDLEAKHGKVSDKKENNGPKAHFPPQQEETGGRQEGQGRQQDARKGFIPKA